MSGQTLGNQITVGAASCAPFLWLANDEGVLGCISHFYTVCLCPLGRMAYARFKRVNAHCKRLSWRRGAWYTPTCRASMPIAATKLALSLRVVRPFRVFRDSNTHPHRCASSGRAPFAPIPMLLVPMCIVFGQSGVCHAPLHQHWCLRWALTRFMRASATRPYIGCLIVCPNPLHPLSKSAGWSRPAASYLSKQPCPCPFRVLRPCRP